MSPELTLAAIVIIPIVILLALRVNAALVFLSLCLGSVLIQFVAPNASSVLDFVATKTNSDVVSASDNTIKLILLLVPPVLTAIFMINTVKGRGRLILNALPAVGVGLLGALLVVPLLPPGLSHNVIDANLWGTATKVDNLIVGGSAIVCLIILWMLRPKAGISKHDKKHKA